jgi:hypothetical protein
MTDEWKTAAVQARNPHEAGNESTGRDIGHIPFDIAGFMARKLLVRLVIRGMFHRLLPMRTPMGRKFRAKMHGHGMPLIRTRPGQLERAGVRRIARSPGSETARRWPKMARACPSRA